MNLPQFYIVNESDGYETFLADEDAVLVPSETLDTERKELLEAGDTEKVFKHGPPFPAITLSHVLELLEKHNLLEDLLENCRNCRKDLDKGQE